MDCYSTLQSKRKRHGRIGHPAARHQEQHRKSKAGTPGGAGRGDWYAGREGWQGTLNSVICHFSLGLSGCCVSESVSILGKQYRQTVPCSRRGRLEGFLSNHGTRWEHSKAREKGQGKEGNNGARERERNRAELHRNKVMGGTLMEESSGIQGRNCITVTSIIVTWADSWRVITSP